MISVVITSTDGSQWVGSAIESVINSTFHDWELIVVDNGSIDDSSAVAQDYADKDTRIKVVRVPRTTPGMAFIKGSQLAQGEWITYLRATDALMPHGLQWLVDHITDDVSLIVGGMQRIEADNEYAMRGNFSGLLSGTNFVKGILLGDFSNEPCGKLIRRENMQPLDHMLDSETRPFHSVYLLLTAINPTDNVYINTGAYICRQHPNGTEPVQTSNFRGWSKAMEIIGNYLTDTNQGRPFYLFRLHSLYRSCVKSGAMPDLSHPMVKALKSQAHLYDLNQSDRQILQTLTNRRTLRREMKRNAAIAVTDEVMVTVVIVAFNDQQGVAATIQSVKNQSLTSWEIIVVDDGSTDDTTDMVRSMAVTDPRIRLIRTSEHKGWASAERLGVNTARGIFITFMRPWCHYEPLAFEKMTTRGIHMGVDIVVMSARRRSRHRLLSYTVYDSHKSFRNRAYNSRDILVRLLTQNGMPWFQYGRVYRLEYLKRITPYNDYDPQGLVLNVISLIQEGKVASVDYEGFIAPASEFDDMAYPDVWAQRFKSFDHVRRIIVQYGADSDERVVKALYRGLGNDLIKILASALRQKWRGGALRFIEETIANDDVKCALEVIGVEPTCVKVIERTEQYRRTNRHKLTREWLMRKL